MTTLGALERGREVFARQAWADAYTQFSAADSESPLAPEDLNLFATTAYLTGRDDLAVGLWERAHHEFLSRGEAERAVQCAFRLAMNRIERGEMATAGG